MAELPVTDQVDDNVTVEFLSELSGEFEGSLDILHRVSVDVENWRVNSLGNVGSIDTGSCLAGVSCETNLVVDNNVDGSTNLIVVERLHLQLLKDDTLTSHSSVTVHDDGNHFVSARFVAAERVLLSADAAHNHGVNSFQVGGVGQESNRNFLLGAVIKSLESLK